MKCTKCKDIGWVWCYSCGSNGVPGQMAYLICGECGNPNGKRHPDIERFAKTVGGY